MSVQSPWPSSIQWHPATDEVPTPPPPDSLGPLCLPEGPEDSLPDTDSDLECLKVVLVLFLPHRPSG